MTDALDLRGQADRLRTAPGGRPLLAEPEWHLVQLHCTTVQALPTDGASLAARLGLDPAGGAGGFGGALGPYAEARDLAGRWEDDAMPAGVNAAVDLRAFARTAEIDYGEMAELAAGGLDAPEPRAEFARLARGRAAQAEECAASAGRARDLVAEFHRAAGALAERARGSAAPCGSDDPAWAKARERLAAAQRGLADANEAYTRAAHAAGTVPNYRWIPLYGLLTAPTADGVYITELLRIRTELEGAAAGSDDPLRLLSEARAGVCAAAAAGALDAMAGHAGRLAALLERLRGGWLEIASGLSALAGTAEADPGAAAASAAAQLPRSVIEWKTLAVQADAHLERTHIARPPYLALQAVV
ncbi:hypothetical protein [Nocardiopsis potens]|uniref:hypothetical protein n=1 Tax=Nocardiopsis potens TaxID=1246458 RepID=UPI000348E0B8|nr:hypothetical protein [Nocardiopsis potens]